MSFTMLVVMPSLQIITDDDDRLLGSQIGIGDVTSGNFQNLDEYENLFDSHRSCNDRFCRLCKSRLPHSQRFCTLQKTEVGNLNLGAIQNEDFEFASVS